ncbi:MAG: MBL fold metallo-hydrolase [Clostridia bacterium]|nr:MBL fold metallo-hydrolase [Clostridia bacterium]
MRFTFCPLFSGSSGNALFVGAGGTRILIDAGLSGRAVSEALNSIGILPETLNGILVTHEHSDHVKGVGILSRKYHLPVYANARTWAAMERQVGTIAPSLHREFETGESFFLGDFSVMPFAIPHDAADPVGYRVYCGACSVATATDMGYFSAKVYDALSGVDILVLESNHDIDMLHANERYSAALKSRILGRHGHLSNEACAEALWMLYQTGVRHVVLGHLSHENNTPELAMRTVCEAMQAHGLVIGRDIMVDMAWRDHVGGVYELE